MFIVDRSSTLQSNMLNIWAKLESWAIFHIYHLSTPQGTISTDERSGHVKLFDPFHLQVSP